jgi:hypothetical protein
MISDLTVQVVLLFRIGGWIFKIGMDTYSFCCWCWMWLSPHPPTSSILRHITIDSERRTTKREGIKKPILMFQLMGRWEEP